MAHEVQDLVDPMCEILRPGLGQCEDGIIAGFEFFLGHSARHFSFEFPRARQPFFARCSISKYQLRSVSASPKVISMQPGGRDSKRPEITGSSRLRNIFSQTSS